MTNSAPARTSETAEPDAASAPASRIGVTLPNRLVLRGLQPADLLGMAEQAEQSGLVGSVWAGDSLLTKPRPEALTVLGAVVARTTRVRVGTMLLASFPFRDPILLAIQAASLDHLSGGRMELGIGVGPGSSGGASAQRELARFGVSSRERLEAFERNVARLRRLWGQETSAGADGESPGGPDADDAPVEPRPVQPRLPILVAGTPPPGDPVRERRVLERVARLGDGWVCDTVSPARFRQLRGLLDEVAASHRLTAAPAGSVVHLAVVVARERGIARRMAEAFLAVHLGVAPGTAAIPHAGAYGPPTLVADHLRSLLDAGVDRVVLRIMALEPRAQLDIILDSVLPRLGVAVAPRAHG